MEEAGAADYFRLLLDGRDRNAVGYSPCALRKNEGGLGSLWSSRCPEPPRLSLGTRGWGEDVNGKQPQFRQLCKGP